MTKSVPFALLAAASLLAGSAAFAAQTPAKPVAKTVTTKTVVAKPATPAPVVAAKPATKTVATRTVAKSTTRTTSGGRMVSAKLSNGKTVTYDCSKPGNAKKKACTG